jgi:hypothetical protein
VVQLAGSNWYNMPLSVPKQWPLGTHTASAYAF